MNDAVKQGTASEMGQGTAVPPSEAGRKSCVWELGSWSKASSGRQKILVTASRYIWRKAIACGSNVSTLLSAPFMRVADLATLDAGVLFSALLLLGCHGMARGWPAQLGGVAGGGRAAALTRESPTVYAAVVSSWKALCRA